MPVAATQNGAVAAVLRTRDHSVSQAQGGKCTWGPNQLCIDANVWQFVLDEAVPHEAMYEARSMQPVWYRHSRLPTVDKQQSMALSRGFALHVASVL